MKNRRNKIVLCGFVMYACAGGCYAFEVQETDSLSPKSLEEVVVTSQTQYTTSEKTGYVPSAREKEVSQTGTELLAQMGIPQIEVDLQSQTVKAAGGGEIGVFINFVPCSKSELAMMPISDVMRVDYYDQPSDPRFQGKPRVINIILRRQNYGGYAKASADAGLLVNEGDLKGIVRNQHKRMTYDLMCAAQYESDDHKGTVSDEKYGIAETSFNRYSTMDNSKYRKTYGQVSLRALYNTDSVVVDNTIEGGMERYPHQDYTGNVAYEGISSPASSFTSRQNSQNGFLAYKGNYFFSFNKWFSLTSKINYVYSRTKENSLYKESLVEIPNSARDVSHEFDAQLLANIDMKKIGQLDLHSRALYTRSKTEYTGTAVASDTADILYWQAGTAYSLSKEHFYGRLGIGWTWIRSTMGSEKSSTNEPYADFFFRYAANTHHSVSLEFHYSEWTPSPNLKSEVQLQVSPYIWRTGNTHLKAFKCYDLGLFYTFLPSKTWSLTAFSLLMAVRDRYAYVYTPMTGQTGILRTLQQPMGVYAQEKIGVNGRLRLFNGALSVNGKLTQTFVQNRSPYYTDLSRLTFQLGCYWYLGDFNFGLTYRSTDRFPESHMYNTVVKTKDNYALSAGWSNRKWNVRLICKNMFRWNWEDQSKISQYDCYRIQSEEFDHNAHANIALSVTYTLNFGKKTKEADEMQEQNLNSSGILR